LRFTASVNGGWAKNKLLEFSENTSQPSWQKAVGHPIGTSNQYIYDGVFRDAKDIADNKIDYSSFVKSNADLRPGDMKFKDITGDGKITADDQKRIDKNDFPTFQGGINANASYRGFDVSILFQGATGAVLRLDPAEWGSIGNFLEYTYNNRWSVENPSSVHPRIADRANTYYSNNNTYWIRNSNYLRLKNAEIGYSLPSSIGKRVGISNFRVYANGLNLITFDKLKVYDPESTNGRGTYYPQARILNLGFTVTF
jgi:TonB-dependent starch-binding outer membrane protein SusC